MIFMNLIAKIKEQDIDPNAPEIDPSNFEHRKAVRAVVINEKGHIALLNTEDERALGFELVWADNIDDAIAMLEADNPSGYDGKRMKPRDLAILRVAKKRLECMMSIIR